MAMKSTRFKIFLFIALVLIARCSSRNLPKRTSYDESDEDDGVGEKYVDNDDDDEEDDDDHDDDDGDDNNDDDDDGDDDNDNDDDDGEF
jgi:hypothetical protein